MYEPKYKLNRRDNARWHTLLTRHCCEAGPKRNPKFPPLTPEENQEFERLDRKRHRKIAAHPKVKASIRRSYAMLRKTRQLAQRFEQAVALLKNRVDKAK